MVLLFVGFAVLWGVFVTLFRYLAAKEAAGKGKPWFSIFVGIGWTSASTRRGRIYAWIAIHGAWIGAVLLVIFVLLAGDLAKLFGYAPRQ